jgi:hypothetical protein
MEFCGRRQNEKWVHATRLIGRHFQVPTSNSPGIITTTFDQHACFNQSIESMLYGQSDGKVQHGRSGVRDQESCNSILTFTTHFVQNVEINNIRINSK